MGIKEVGGAVTRTERRELEVRNLLCLLRRSDSLDVFEGTTSTQMPRKFCSQELIYLNPYPLTRQQGMNHKFLCGTFES